MNKILLLYESYPELMSVESFLRQVGFNVIGLSSEYSILDQMLSFHPDVLICAGRGGRVNPLSVGKRLREMLWWQGKCVLLFPENFKPTAQDLGKIRVDLILEAPVEPRRIVQVLANLLGLNEKELLGHVTDPFAAEAVIKESIPTSASQARPSLDKDNDKHFVVGYSLNLLAPESMKAAENELVGGGAPKAERVESSKTLSQSLSNENSSIQQEVVRHELQKANSKLSAKMKKYSEIVSNVKVSETSTLSLVEVRRRQKDMAADWDAEKLGDLDELRREFAVALGKK